MRRTWTYAALWTVAALFVVSVALIAASVIRQRRADALEQGRSQAALAVVGAETVLNRTFLSIDVLLAGLEDLVGDQMSGHVDERAQHSLAGVVRRNLVVRDIVLLNDKGAVLASAIPATGRIGLQLPPGLLTAALAAPVPALSVSQPADNFVTAETVFYFARRFEGNGGEPVVAVAVVPESQVSAALSPGGLVPSLSITLERSDGQLLASNPPGGMPAARRIAQPIKPEFRDGSARVALGRVDGAPAVVAARALLQEGLLVASTLPLSAVLSRAEDDQRNVLAVAVLSGLLVLVTAAVTHAHLRRMDRARRDIERNRDWLDQALASMRDGLLLCDADGGVVAWNARYLEFFPWLASAITVGMPYEQLLRISVDNLFPELDESGRALYYRHRLEEHRAGHTSTEYQLGAELRLQVTETRTPAGGVVGVYRDVTSTERELTRARQAELAAGDARDQFVTTVASQISQPANNVLGMAELLLRSDLPPAQKRYVSWAAESAREILFTIDDLLELSRLQGESVPRLEFSELEPRRVVQEGIAHARRHGSRRPMTVSLTVSSTLPPVLWGDAERVQQAISGLVRGSAELCAGDTLNVNVRHEGLQDGRALLLISTRGASASRRFEGVHAALEDSAATKPGALPLQLARRLGSLMGGALLLDDGHAREPLGLTLQLVLATVGESAELSAASTHE